MASRRERRRLRFSVDDGERLALAWGLHLDEDRLCLDVGTIYPRGSELRLVPLSEDGELDLRELHGRVVSTSEDVLSSADAEHRFLMVAQLELDEVLRERLQRAVRGTERSPRGLLRARPRTHDAGFLQAAMERLRGG